jgi:hypothetical protein
VIIQNGQARYAGGGDFTVSGRVQPSGGVRATISRGVSQPRRSAFQRPLQAVEPEVVQVPLPPPSAVSRPTATA